MIWSSVRLFQLFIIIWPIYTQWLHWYCPESQNILIVIVFLLQMQTLPNASQLSVETMPISCRHFHFHIHKSDAYQIRIELKFQHWNFLSYPIEMEVLFFVGSSKRNHSNSALIFISNCKCIAINLSKWHCIKSSNFQRIR